MESIYGIQYRCLPLAKAHTQISPYRQDLLGTLLQGKISEKRKATNALAGIHTGYGLRGLIISGRGFPLVAALMLVLMVSVVVRMLVRVVHRLVAVLVPVVGVRSRLVAVLVLMFVFAMAAHPASPPCQFISINFMKLSGCRQAPLRRDPPP
jgi:hypothetical protein